VCEANNQCEGVAVPVEISGNVQGAEALALRQAEKVYQALLGRDIDPGAAEAIQAQARAAGFDPFLFGLQIQLSGEYLDRLIARATDAHLLLIHAARLRMIRRFLPAARRIIDLGGANAPLYRMGYRHAFERLVMVDLPPDARHEMYRDIPVHDAPDGVTVHYSDMTELKAFADESFDLVWSGQSIEHVDREAGHRMCREAMRLLRPGGYFCLDTPNRGITRIHTQGGFIHPEHKHEYAANELHALLVGVGFSITQEYGICEMPETVATGQLTPDVEKGYILYFGCTKPPA
jgi:SAM-dependent methyltransferase